VRRTEPCLNIELRMSRSNDTRFTAYTDRARDAILRAARTEHDFGGWLAAVLAAVAAELGSSSALTAGRPGPWEAGLVQELVKGSAGWGDESLGYLARE
jgi:hypothetical protein